MKTIKMSLVLMMGLAVAACANNGETTETAEGEVSVVAEKTLKDYTSSKAEIDSVSYLLGINFGSFLKAYNFGDDINFSQVVKGMKDFQAAKGDMNDPEFEKQFKIAPSKLNDVFNAYLEKRHNYTLLENKQKEDKFLAENAKKDGVQVTESGLQYRIIEAGSDVKPAATDTVWVKYEGKLLDGTVFDKTEEDAEPVHFTLNRVVKGWSEGLQLIGEGGKIELAIPAKLGYGERGNQRIAPNSTLLFNVELVKVGKVAAAE